MTRSIDDYFAFNNAALTVKNQRLELVSGNIANASTPGFKAKDWTLQVSYGNLLIKPLKI